jgi:SAM-dependent methyltransferase
MSQRNDIDPQLIGSSKVPPKLVTPVVDNGPILETVFARWRMASMSGALEVGIYEALAEKSAGTVELARNLGLDERAVRAVLAVLAGSKILTAHGGQFGLTAAARTYLLKDSPFFFGAKLATQARSSREHAELMKAMRPVKRKKKSRWWWPVDPVDAWEGGKLTREMAKGVAAYMQAECVGLAAGAARSGVYRGIKRMLDVGGGSGAMAIAISEAQPEIEGLLIDLPAMCEEANTYIRSAGLEGRVKAQAVDMFREPWPEGFDGIVFSNIFHDWSVETCEELARLAYEALVPGGRVFLHEMLMADDQGGPTPTAGFSAQMLLDTRGQQYSFVELRDFLEKAGFENIGVTHSFGYYSVVTGTKAR